MKVKKKINKKRIKRNNNQDSNKVHHTLNSFNANYYLPEFSTNKTIKKYIATKLLNNKKLKENNNINIYTKTIEPKNKITSLSKEKIKNSKLLFRKHNNKSETIPTNEGNFENVNTHNSVAYKTTNISNTETFNNDYLNQGAYSYREMIPFNSINSTENIYLNNSSNIKNKNIVIFSKKHIINKLNSNVNNRKIKTVFNNDYYTYHNYYKNKSYNNILKDNGIYVKIKNINNNKIKKNGVRSKETIILTPDKNKFQKNKNQINSNLNNLNKDNNININKNPISKNNEQNVNKKKKIFKNREDLIIKKKIENCLTVKEDNNIINYILNSIVKNASKIEKKLNREKKENRSRLFSPLLNKNKNNNMIINNANIIKCGFADRGKYIFEYQNQIKRK